MGCKSAQADLGLIVLSIFYNCLFLFSIIIMFDAIIKFSINNKIIIGMMVLALVGWGGYSLTQLPIDAIPDVTNNQVVILSQTPTLAAQEVEQYITSPIEQQMANLQGVEEISSTSRLGLSVITIVFDESMPMLQARQ